MRSNTRRALTTKDHPGKGLHILDPLLDGLRIRLRTRLPEHEVPDPLVAALGEETGRLPRRGDEAAGLAVSCGDCAAKEAEHYGALARLVCG